MDIEEFSKLVNEIDYSDDDYEGGLRTLLAILHQKKQDITDLFFVTFAISQNPETGEDLKNIFENYRLEVSLVSNYQEYNYRIVKIEKE